MSADRLHVAVVGIAPESIHFRTYVEHLFEAGFPVTVVTNKNSAGLPVPVVNFARHRRYMRFAPAWVRDLVRAGKLRRALSGRGFDVVNVQQMTPDGVFAALVASGPVVPTFWGSDILQLSRRSWYVRRLMRRAISRATLLHATSAEIERRLVELGADPARIRTFQYGIDLGLFALREGPAEPGLVVSTRGLTPFYRPDALVSALAEILPRVPEARLVLAGSGNPGDLERLRQLAERLGVSERVTFPGTLTPAEVASLLRRASVWASLPPSDSLALSLQEAMGCGAYPLVTDLPSMHEALDEGAASFVADVSPAPLAARLEAALAASATDAHVAVNRAAVERFGDREVNLAAFERMLAEAAAMGRDAR